MEVQPGIKTRFKRNCYAKRESDYRTGAEGPSGLGK
jgi:hypothetical protein